MAVLIDILDVDTTRHESFDHDGDSSPHLFTARVHDVAGNVVTLYFPDRDTAGYYFQQFAESIIEGES